MQAVSGLKSGVYMEALCGADEKCIGAIYNSMTGVYEDKHVKQVAGSSYSILRGLVR